MAPKWYFSIQPARSGVICYWTMQPAGDGVDVLEQRSVTTGPRTLRFCTGLSGPPCCTSGQWPWSAAWLPSSTLLELRSSIDSLNFDCFIFHFCRFAHVTAPRSKLVDSSSLGLNSFSFLKVASIVSLPVDCFPSPMTIPSHCRAHLAFLLEDKFLD